MKNLTVFTPTYNRVHLLPRLYESLCRQSSQDFLWLIIDDGSVDGTEELVEGWIAENKIQIHYHFKENGGMHTGHNAAYKLIETKLNVCIDSDDFMPDNAVEKILERWSRADKNKFSGMVGLDTYKNGKIIGKEFPVDFQIGSYNDIYYKRKITGDKKFVLVTEEVKKYPLYPEYENERLVPLGILYIMMGDNKPFLLSNDVFCVVEYQAEGSSKTILKQYFQSPKGFMHARKIRLKYRSNTIDKLKNILHLSTTAYILGDFTTPLKDNKYCFLTLLFYPLGLVNYLILKKQ